MLRRAPPPPRGELDVVFCAQDFGPFAFGSSTKETGCSPRASLQVCLKVLCVCAPLQCISAHVCKHLACECMALCVQRPLLRVFVCGEHGVEGIDHCLCPTCSACLCTKAVCSSYCVGAFRCVRARARPCARAGLRCACPRRPGGQRPPGRRPPDALSTTTTTPRPTPRHPRALPLRAAEHPAGLWAERRARGRSGAFLRALRPESVHSIHNTPSSGGGRTERRVSD